MNCQLLLKQILEFLLEAYTVWVLADINCQVMVDDAVSANAICAAKQSVLIELRERPKESDCILYLSCNRLYQYRGNKSFAVITAYS